MTLKGASSPLLKITANPELAETAYTWLFSTFGGVSSESCGLGDVCGERLSALELGTLTPVSPTQPCTLVTHETTGQ